MFKKLLIGGGVFLFSFLILFVSILRTAEIKYSATYSNPSLVLNSSTKEQENKISIGYILPNPGQVLPGNIFWPVKALRDKIWMGITTSQTKKAELALLLADKRLVSSKILLDNHEYSLALATLSKAEKYLEEASDIEKKNRAKGLETKDFLSTLALASLKHREIIRLFQDSVSEDAKSAVIKLEDYPKHVYEEAMHALQEKKLSVPNNPFDRD